MSRTRFSSQSKTQQIVLIALAVALLGTVFLLPRFVDEPWFAGEAGEQAPIPTPSAETVAPSTAAELKRYRQDSQIVLAEIILVRDRLLARNVGQWADVDFQHALGEIKTGDEEYGYGNYESSLRYYRQARERLSDLEVLGQHKLEKAKSDGFAAVESLNAVLAQSSSELATAIAADDSEVQRLAGRVETLPEVAAHIEAGDHALERDRFEEARSAYQQALDLDPAHQRAAEGLSLARREITGGAFRRQMSQGFAALESGDYEGARSAFRKAAEIEPGNPAIEQALAQVTNRESMSFVNSELARATQLESSEQWAEAVTIYEALLAEDPSLTDARARLIPARVRAELDGRISGFVDDPLRLSNRAEYESAQATLTDAQGIPGAGPRLQGQIDELQTLLKRATTPVDVVFRSDNQTHVVLYRVSELGQFEQTSVRLRPGRYVVAGTRKGYRDVRVEFTVTGEPLDEAIVVRCEEPIG